MIINGPVSVSIQQQPSFSLEQIMEISQLLQQQQQQSQQVVSQQKNDFIVIDDNEKSESSPALSGSQIAFLRDCPHCGKSLSIESIYEKHVKKCLKKKMAKESLLSINSQKKESIKKNKTPEVPIADIYVIKKPDGSYYCSICKRRFEDRGCILMHINKSEEHRYNKLFGKNVFKIPLAKKLVCPFSSCNKEFNDIDDFVDHIIGAHVKGKRCPFPQCKININVVTNLRTHIARHHTQSDMFYTCPGCPLITCKCSSDIIGNHIPNCDNFKKLVERITKQNQSQQNNENGFICEK